MSRVTRQGWGFCPKYLPNKIFPNLPPFTDWRCGYFTTLSLTILLSAPQQWLWRQPLITSLHNQHNITLNDPNQDSQPIYWTEQKTPCKLPILCLPPQIIAMRQPHGRTRSLHHHDCVTSGQYVLFQHPIILSLDYDEPIWNSKVKYMDFEKLKK